MEVRGVDFFWGVGIWREFFCVSIEGYYCFCCSSVCVLFGLLFFVFFYILFLLLFVFVLFILFLLVMVGYGGFDDLEFILDCNFYCVLVVFWMNVLVFFWMNFGVVVIGVEVEDDEEEVVVSKEEVVGVLV